ncbi:hypothetical protein CVT24_000040, partial [Panaeolus cyanescens]
TKPAKRIYDEYSWYERLAEAGVTEGIVKVHGIFEDVETGATALMMQYGGTSLLHRERLQMPRKTRGDKLSSTQVTLSEGELKQLLKIIRGINDAGITHNDLKPDNIVVDDAGRVSIIDFDMAEDIYLRKNYTRTPDSDAAQVILSPKLMSTAQMFYIRTSRNSQKRYFDVGTKSTYGTGRKYYRVLRHIPSSPTSPQALGQVLLLTLESPTLKSPLRFIDRHLSPELTLKRVVLVESLAHDLDNAMRPEFWNFLKVNDIFPTKDYSTTSQYLHEGILFIYGDTLGGELDDFVLEKEVIEKVEPVVVAKLRHLRDKYDALASFHFLPPCPASRRIIAEISLFKPEDWLVSAVESPISLPKRSDCKPLDSPAAWWSHYGSYGRQQTQVHVHPVSTAYRKKTVRIPPHCSRRSINYKPEASHFLQRVGPCPPVFLLFLQSIIYC